MDDSEQKQVASVVEQTTRFNFYKITIAQGIVIDPRHPSEATVFALVVNPSELLTLRDRLRKAVHDRVEETPIDPKVVTQLADIGQVQACPPSPMADVEIPRGPGLPRAESRLRRTHHPRRRPLRETRLLFCVPPPSKSEVLPRRSWRLRSRKPAPTRRLLARTISRPSRGTGLNPMASPARATRRMRASSSWSGSPDPARVDAMVVGLGRYLRSSGFGISACPAGMIRRGRRALLRNACHGPRPIDYSSCRQDDRPGRRGPAEFGASRTKGW